MYRAYALLQPGSDFTLTEAVSRLQERFPEATVSQFENQITVALDEWEMELRLNEDESVLMESIALAEKIAGLADDAELDSCRRRVEIWSETPDPFVEHLSDFHLIVEMMKSFRNTILVDPSEPALM